MLSLACNICRLISGVATIFQLFSILILHTFQNPSINAFRKQASVIIHLVYWIGKRGTEEPGNPVVPAGALQPGRQEILQRTAAWGVTMDHKAIWSLSRSAGRIFSGTAITTCRVVICNPFHNHYIFDHYPLIALCCQWPLRRLEIPLAFMYPKGYNSSKL